MNYSQARELKDGDEVVFRIPFLPFTLGRKYKARDTKGGLWITSENGISYPLTVELYSLNEHFTRVKEEQYNQIKLL